VPSTAGRATEAAASRGRRDQPRAAAPPPRQLHGRGHRVAASMAEGALGRWARRRAASSPTSRGGARRCHAGGAAGRIALEGTLVAVGRELCFTAAARRTLGCRPWMGARRRCGLPLPAVLGRSRVASAPSMVVGCGRARAVTSSMVGGTELADHGTDPSSLHCFLMVQLLYIGVAIIFLACCNCSSS
jgi:hypothetical protein